MKKEQAAIQFINNHNFSGMVQHGQHKMKHIGQIINLIVPEYLK